VEAAHHHGRQAEHAVSGFQPAAEALQRRAGAAGGRLRHPAQADPGVDLQRPGNHRPRADPPSLPGYNAKIAALPYDPAKAKALLREAGYPEGLEVELLLTPTTNNRRLFDVLEASLRGVGITLRPGFRERAVYFRERGAGNFAIARADWIADYLDAGTSSTRSSTRPASISAGTPARKWTN
jgi:ABC-type transport system substrate-binding protein